jgi:hypothetical protein
MQKKLVEKLKLATKSSLEQIFLEQSVYFEVIGAFSADISGDRSLCFEPNKMILIKMFFLNLRPIFPVLFFKYN